MFKVSVFCDETLYIEPRLLDVVYIKTHADPGYTVIYRDREYQQVTQDVWSAEIVKPLMSKILETFKNTPVDEPPSPVCIKVVYQDQTGAEYLLSKRFIWCPRGFAALTNTTAS